ncbi:MAG: hypothetical protein QW478_08290 [Candidatus Micrarchaeaceae archaeon]
MSENVNDKKEYTSPHSNETENRAQNFRYQTIYPNAIDNFGKHLIGRLLTLELANNKTLTGKLKSFGQFDVIITETKTGHDILVFKHAIMTVQGDLSSK